MIARKCDRCGSFYIPEDNMRTYIVSKKSLINIEIDLCPECHDDLITFMANPNMVHVYLKYKKEELHD